MKLRVHLKDPDALGDAAREFGFQEAKKRLGVAYGNEEIPNEEMDNLSKYWRSYVMEASKSWFKWEEYVTVEIDLLAKTATVIPTGEQP